MDEAGVSGREKLQAVKNIYEAMGIKLFEKQEIPKHQIDYKIDELVKELANELTEYECKVKMLEISKDKTISDKVRYGSMYVYFQVLKMIRDKYINKFY